MKNVISCSIRISVFTGAFHIRISSRIGNHRFGGSYRNYDLLSFDFFGNVYLGSMDIGFNGNSLNKRMQLILLDAKDEER